MVNLIIDNEITIVQMALALNLKVINKSSFNSLEFEGIKKESNLTLFINGNNIGEKQIGNKLLPNYNQDIIFEKRVRSFIGIKN